MSFLVPTFPLVVVGAVGFLAVVGLAALAMVGTDDHPRFRP